MVIKTLFFELYTEKSPRVLSTQAHVDRSVSIFKEPHVESQVIKFIGYSVVFGGSSDKEEENEYSLGKIKVCNIPVIAAPILLGILLSISKVAIERQDFIFDQTFFQKVSFSLSKRQLRDRVEPIWTNTPKPGSISLMKMLQGLLLMGLKAGYMIYFMRAQPGISSTAVQGKSNPYKL